jgi:(+)-pinoresinol hydroxylase
VKRNVKTKAMSVGQWAVAFALVVAFSVRAEDAATIGHGDAVFQKWCAPCHGRGADRPGTVALQALYHGSKPAALEDRIDLSPEFIKQFVRHGVSVMAPFRKTEVSDADLAALTAYLTRTKR